MAPRKKKARSSKSDLSSEKKQFLLEFEKNNQFLRSENPEYYENLLEFYRVQKNNYFVRAASNNPIEFRCAPNETIRARIKFYNDPLEVKQIGFRCKVQWFGEMIGGEEYRSGATNQGPGGTLQTPSEWINLYTKGEFKKATLIVQFEATVSALTKANNLIEYSALNVDPFFWTGDPNKSGITTIPIILSPSFGTGIFVEIEGKFQLLPPRT
jgi:hypothetical protein